MRSRAVWIVPIVLAALEAGALGLLSLRQRWAMFQFDDDLANYDQVIWNTTQGAGSPARRSSTPTTGSAIISRRSSRSSSRST